MEQKLTLFDTLNNLIGKDIMNILFNEAVDALVDVIILSPDEADNIINKFERTFPFDGSGCGKIDWDEIKKKSMITHISEVEKYESYSLDDKCFVIWNDQSCEILETNLGNVINAFDDVIAVSFDTWIFIPSKNNVIENTFGSLTMTL